MPDLADLYPGFASHWIDTSAGRIFTRGGGKGPPLLLLHGYPQTNVMWHRVAPALAVHFSLIIPDLPGYGWSDAPPSDATHAPYTKRAMAAVIIEAMAALGHVRFRLAGHDRGGRVAYRLALDHPGRLERLAVLDIVPTWAMWHRMDARLATRAAAGTKIKNLSAFDPRALAHYHAFFDDPVRIHATCEDYRAGRTTDLAHDEETRASGQKITCPLLAIWGAAGGLPAETEGPLATWREWAINVRGFALDCGHYLAEEAPDATAKALLEFFTSDR